MLTARNKIGLRLIAGAMVAGLLAGPAAFAAPAYSSCVAQGSNASSSGQTNHAHGSVQATGVVGSSNLMSCSPGSMAIAKSEQAFHTNGTGVQSGTHWILNK